MQFTYRHATTHPFMPMSIFICDMVEKLEKLAGLCLKVWSSPYQVSILMDLQWSLK